MARHARSCPGKVAGVALLRYWAGARAAAGVPEESFAADTLAELLEAARIRRGGDFRRVLDACSFVVDEQPVGRGKAGEVAVGPDTVVEVLPPFAGGASERVECGCFSPGIENAPDVGGSAYRSGG